MEPNVALASTATELAAQFASRTNDTAALVQQSGHWSEGLAITFALAVVLAHLSVVSARPERDSQLRAMLASVSIPLLVTFATFVLYRSLQIVLG